MKRIKLFDIFNSKYSCSKCRVKLRSHADKLIHTEIIHGKDFNPNFYSNRKYKCIYCTECFKLYSQLKDHLNQAHLNKSLRACKIRSVEFENRIVLKSLHGIEKHASDFSLHANNKWSFDSNKPRTSSTDLFKREFEHSCIKGSAFNACRVEPSMNSTKYMMSHNRVSPKFDTHLIAKHRLDAHQENNVADRINFVANSELTPSQNSLFKYLSYQLEVSKQLEEVNEHIRRQSEKNQETGCKSYLDCNEVQRTRIDQDSSILFSANEKGAMCSCCGFDLPDDSGFRNQHFSMHLSVDQKRPYKCHLCHLKFSKPEQVLRHMTVHDTKNPNFLCSICFSTFSRKQDLGRHMSFHGGTI
jgi:hypothetical protein